LVLVVWSADGILRFFQDFQELVMAKQSFEASTPLQALVLEQALLLARQLEQTAAAAPHGQVLARVEAVAVAAGRELARKALEATLQAQAVVAEQKGPQPGSVPAVPEPAGLKASPPGTS
jgi:hypothetical protein